MKERTSNMADWMESVVRGHAVDVADRMESRIGAGKEPARS